MYLKILPKDDSWNISTAYINFKKCFETFGKNFTSIYQEYSEPFSPESVTHRHQLNDNLILELTLGYCRINKTPSLSKVLRSPVEGDIFFSLEKLEGSVPKATGYYKKRKRLRSKVQTEDFSKNVFLEYSNHNITCSTGSLELTMSYQHVVVGKIYAVRENEIILHPLVMGPPIKGIAYLEYLPEFLRSKSYSSLEQAMLSIKEDTSEIKLNQDELKVELINIGVELKGVNSLLIKLTQDFQDSIRDIADEIDEYEKHQLEQEWNNELLQDEVRKLLSDVKNFKISLEEKTQITGQLNQSDISAKHKLKFIIPLFFLRYESEIEIGNKQILPKSWKEWKRLFVESD